MAEAFAWAFSGPIGLAALILGYLFGSIPFGIILTRLAGGPDLRTIGSGNIGATNVLRTGNKKLAALTLLGDMLKGTAAVVLAGWLLGGKAAALAAGLGAFLGHLFPVWLRFKGGKGVATFLGILIGLKWSIALIFAAVWLSIAYLSKYSSLSALIARPVSTNVSHGEAAMPSSPTRIACTIVSTTGGYSFNSTVSRA